MEDDLPGPDRMGFLLLGGAVPGMVAGLEGAEGAADNLEGERCSHAAGQEIRRAVGVAEANGCIHRGSAGAAPVDDTADLDIHHKMAVVVDGAPAGNLAAGDTAEEDIPEEDHPSKGGSKTSQRHDLK